MAMHLAFEIRRKLLKSVQFSTFGLFISNSNSSIMPCATKDCVCAQKSTCSCGKEAALHCTCSRAAEENAVPPKEKSCACGQRLKDKCNCGVAASSCHKEGEIDFTGKA